MTVGERIRKRREQLGYTQETLAFKLGYKGRSSVNKVENSNDVTMKKLKMYAEALDTTVSYLAGWEDDILEIDTDSIVDVMSRPHILEYAKRLMMLSESSQQTIYDNIDFLLKKEGRD